MAVNTAALQAMTRRLNNVTKQPLEPFIDGKWQVGNFHVEHANGRIALLRVANESGACTNVFYGYATKRELYDQMYAFVRGFEFAQQGV